MLFRSDIESLAPSHIVISPGPCTPKEAGISVPTIKHFAGRIPILGVCLGHQSIGEAFGGNIIRAKRVMHGKISAIHHAGAGIFGGLGNGRFEGIFPKPTPPTGLGPVLDHFMANPASFAIRADGTLMMWGNGSHQMVTPQPWLKLKLAQ